MILTLIAAAGSNNEIGKDNQIIWHLPNDFRRFKAITTGHHIIMGRKTFESFPKPLPNRTHVIITRQKHYKAPDGCIVVGSLEQAMMACNGEKEVFIIGGGEIYAEAMPLADRIELTKVFGAFDADTFFPKIDFKEWNEIERTANEEDDTHCYKYHFITYVRSK